MTLVLANGLFDAGAVLGYLHRHAIPGVEEVDLTTGRVRRLLSAAGGSVAVDLTLEHGAAGPAVGLADPSAEPSAEVITLVRQWFDLDTALAPVGRVLDRDPVLAAVGAVSPGLRITGYPDGFEGVIATVLGQQVSLAAARTLAGRLVAAYGTDHPSGLLAFPDPARLAAVPLEALRATVGLTGARARTIQAVARHFADGFTLSTATDPGRARAELSALPGIGSWTVEYLAMRVMHDPDACPASDLVLRRALGLDRPADVLRRAQGWRPYRAYAVLRLWTAALTPGAGPSGPVAYGR